MVLNSTTPGRENWKAVQGKVRQDINNLIISNTLNILIGIVIDAN